MNKLQETIEKTGARQIWKNVQSFCVVTYVTFRQWTGRYRIHQARILVDDQELDAELASAPSWNFFPKEHERNLRRYCTQARIKVQQYSVGFRGGVYLTPRGRLADMLHGLHKIQEEHRKAAKDFAQKWGELREQQIERVCRDYGDSFRLELDKKLPTSEEMEQLFQIEYGLWPGNLEDLLVECIPDLNICRSNLALLEGKQFRELRDALQRILARVEEGEDRLLRKYLGSLTREEQSQLERNTQRFVQQALEVMFQEPLKEFSQALDTLVKVYREDRSFRSTSLDVLRRSYEKLQSFEFILPQDTRERMQQARELLRFDSNSLNQKHQVRDQFMSLVQEIRKEVEEAQGRGISSVAKRFLDV